MDAIFQLKRSNRRGDPVWSPVLAAGCHMGHPLQLTPIIVSAVENLIKSSRNIQDNPMTDPFLKYRDEFPILEKCTYLISNSLGAMPKGVYDSLHHFADVWAEHGVSAWGVEWFELNRVVSDTIAPLMG